MKKKSHFFSGGSIAVGRPNLFVAGNNITFMFSFSLANTAYTGNCIRLRRSSDNLEVDIPYVNGFVDELAILSHCGTSNGFIVTQYDQSGNDNHASSNTLQIVFSGVIFKRNNRIAVNGANGGRQGTISSVNTDLGSVFNVAYSQTGNDLAFPPYTVSSSGVFHTWLDGGSSGFFGSGAYNTNTLSCFINSVEVLPKTRGQLHIDALKDDVVMISSVTSVNRSQMLYNFTNSGFVGSFYQLETIITDGLPWDRTFIENNIKDYYGL